LKELPEAVRQGVTFRLVETMDEVLEIALNPGEPRPAVVAEPEAKPLPTAH
jgi:ATP-dependent Lon protease